MHGKNQDQAAVDEVIKENAAKSKKEKEVQYMDQLRQFLPFYGRPIAAIDLKPIGVDPLEPKSKI